MKLKPGLGTFYAITIRLENRSDLFYKSWGEQVF